MKNTKAWSVKMRLALLALATLVWIAVPVSARAEGETVDTWDGITIADGFAVGTGTENNPYQINTAAELAYFAKSVNGGQWYDGKYIILKNNINLNNQEWIPIGNDRNSFRGNFDGGNHTVTGMRISNSSADYVGLFGECTRYNINSAIKNITVENSVITGKVHVGAIIGYAGEINIENCQSVGNTVNGNKKVGGISGSVVGSVSYAAKIVQCYNSSTVTGEYFVGGIVGAGDRCIAENCLNTGEIKGNYYGSAGGGIFGILSTNTSQITACINWGKISEVRSGYGGIAGEISGAQILNCYYNKDTTGAWGIGNQETTEGITPLTTGQLCGALPSGLDSAIWKEGSVDISTAKVTQGRFGTATGTYINLTKVADIKETKTAPVPVYNYVTTNGDDWDTYTLITTAEEFVAIGRDDTKWSGNYVLENDIDVSGVKLSSIGDPEIPYIGKFSGDGHTISHIDMTEDKHTDSSGLFGTIGYSGTLNNEKENGKVMLLAANGDIVSSDKAGGICGYLSVGEIYGCSFTGTVKGSGAGGDLRHERSL